MTTSITETVGACECKLSYDVRACIGIPGREAKARVNLQIIIIALTCDQQEGKIGIHPEPPVLVQRGLGIRVILDGIVNVGLLLVWIDGGGNCQPKSDVVGMLLLWILGVVHKVFFGQREGANTNEATVNHTIVIKTKGYVKKLLCFVK